jgi:hypothetical protein
MPELSGAENCAGTERFLSLSETLRGFEITESLPILFASLSSDWGRNLQGQTCALADVLGFLVFEAIGGLQGYKIRDAKCGELRSSIVFLLAFLTPASAREKP